MRRVLFATVVLLAQLVAQVSLADDAAGWPRADIVAEISRLAGKELKLESAENVPANLLLDPTEKQSCFVGPGDTTQYVDGGNSVWSVFLVSRGDRVHTLHIYFAPVNAGRDSNPAAILQGLFRYMFPDWEDAEQWPIESLNSSWDAAGRAMVDPTVSFNDTVARHATDTVRLATTGVPPDIVWYRVTTRPDCEKISPFMLASPREPIKDAARRDAHQTRAQMLLNYVHPEPVDISATPYLIGSASATRPFSGTRVNFDSPQASIDLATWIDRQGRSTRYASTTAAIEDFWGYQSFYLYLVTDPAVPATIAGEPGVAIVEKMNSWVNRSTSSGLAVEPFDVEAVFFTGTPPAVLPKARDLPATYEGSTQHFLVRSSDAVDVSATPIHLGRMHLYSPGHSADKPGYYAVEPSDLGLAITDRASGETTRVDLKSWAAANGAFETSAGSYFMVDPVVRFEFLGKPHALVLDGISIDVTIDSGDMWMTGQLFTAR